MKIIKVPDIETSNILYNPRFQLTTTNKLPLIVDTLSGHTLEFKNDEFSSKKMNINDTLLLEENRAIIVCNNHPKVPIDSCAVVLIELNIPKGCFKEVCSFKGPPVEANFKYTRLIADQLDPTTFICYNPHYNKFFCFSYSSSKARLYHLKNIVVHIHRPLTCLRLCSETLCGFFYENVMSMRRFQVLDFNEHLPYTYKANISTELLKTVPHSMITTKFKRIGSRTKEPALDPIQYTELYSWSGDRLFVVANWYSTIILSFDSISMTWLGPIIKLQRPIKFLRCLDLENLLVNEQDHSLFRTSKLNGFNIIALRVPIKLKSLTIRAVIKFNLIDHPELPKHQQIKRPF